MHNSGRSEIRHSGYTHTQTEICNRACVPRGNQSAVQLVWYFVNELWRNWAKECKIASLTRALGYWPTELKEAALLGWHSEFILLHVRGPYNRSSGCRGVQWWKPPVWSCSHWNVQDSHSPNRNDWSLTQLPVDVNNIMLNGLNQNCRAYYLCSSSVCM